MFAGYFCVVKADYKPYTFTFLCVCRKQEGGAGKEGEGQSISASDDEDRPLAECTDAAKKEKRLMAPRKKFEWTPEIKSVKHTHNVNRLGGLKLY